MNYEINTFADARRFILDTVVALRKKEIDVSTGMAIAANMKVLNDNIFAEIAAAKVSILTDGKAHNFGQLTNMGQRLLSNKPPEANNG